MVDRTMASIIRPIDPNKEEIIPSLLRNGCLYEKQVFRCFTGMIVFPYQVLSFTFHTRLVLVGNRYAFHYRLCSAYTSNILLESILFPAGFCHKIPL
mmetsp:Transcript_72866/g.142916  ORF Transcript_72866/g.142916 Transcript_72866/m.142916 type:complete len:97 (+) Transcript_72866:848-1138(+)